MKELRGHHLFCTALFSGSGYDDRFVENMVSLIEGWKAGGNLRLCGGHDAVCTACPNRQPDGGCSLGTEDVLRRDQAALKALGLEPGQEVSWAQAQKLLRAASEEEFQSVCGSCRWQAEGLCSYQLLQKRVKA